MKVKVTLIYIIESWKMFAPGYCSHMYTYTWMTYLWYISQIQEWLNMPDIETSEYYKVYKFVNLVYPLVAIVRATILILHHPCDDTSYRFNMWYR